MEKLNFLGICIVLLCIFSCASDKNGGGAGLLGGSASYVTSANGVKYIIHNAHDGTKAKFGDFLSMNLQYTTTNDSLIFSSYKKPKPLSFKFQKTLFKGVLNEGLQQMAALDSATFLVPADSIWGERLPNYLKPGDKIKYTVSLLKIQTQEEYQEERNARLDRQRDVDTKEIEAYLAKSGDKLEKTASGLYYGITKAGSGKAPSNDDVATAKYTVTLLDGTEVESTSGKFKELPLNRQIRGLREGIGLLKKGGSGTLLIPSTIAYGERKRGKIPPNSNLIYTIEISDIGAAKQ
jgi:FKBP-type peptidyl-prolyl cis-trans isomerase